MQKLKNNKNKIIIFISMIISCLVMCFTLTTKAYTINENGNLVGDNLLSGMTHSTTNRFNTAYYSNNSIEFQENVIYTFVCDRNYNDNMVSSYYLNERLFDMVDGYSRYFLTNTTDKYIAQFTANGVANSSDIIIKNERDNTTTYYINDLYNFMILEGAYTIENVPNYEPYGIWYSETNYNTQEQYYKDLLNNNSNVIYNALNGATAKIVDTSNYERIYAQDTITMPTNAISFESASIPNISNYITNYDSEDTEHYPDQSVALLINFNFQINNQIMFQYNNTIIDYQYDFINTIAQNKITENRDNTYPYFSLQNKDKFVFNQIVINSIKMPDYTYIDFNISLEAVSYANGYSDGIESQRLTIKDQANRISKLENQIEQGNKQQYQLGYNDGFNQGASSGNQLYNMIIAVADTPINIFKQIFNFNILGLDISGFIFGIISLIIIIWLIKKII